MEIRIPVDYFEGHSCLEYEIPWQTPESIFKEAENINENDVALEIGSGGSTLFLARRCAKVLSYETNNEWFTMVKKKAEDCGIDNIWFNLINLEDTICYALKNTPTDYVTIFSVDTQGGYNRSRILNAFLSKGISPSLKMIILDNYAHPELFPDHWDKGNVMGDDWDMFDFNHDRWAGNGTRIYLKNKQI